MFYHSTWSKRRNKNNNKSGKKIYKTTFCKCKERLLSKMKEIYEYMYHISPCMLIRRVFIIYLLSSLGFTQKIYLFFLFITFFFSFLVTCWLDLASEVFVWSDFLHLQIFDLSFYLMYVKKYSSTFRAQCSVSHGGIFWSQKSKHGKRQESNMLWLSCRSD